MDYYVPAYLALVTASVALISLPTHIAANRELGVLKRYRAAGVPSSTLVASEVAVTFVIATTSAVVLMAAAMPAYDVVSPESTLLVAGGFVLVALTFSALGILLGAVLPSSRAAQAFGVLLWFVFLMVGGAGPPPEVLTGAMGTVGALTPLRWTILVIQHGWLGLDPGWGWPAVTALGAVCGVAAIRFFRWE
jgi:ABC-2 type transport system permease protein